MKRAVIISAGRVTDHVAMKKFVKPTDTVICADGGYDHAQKMGVRVDVLIGDLDSIRDKEKIADQVKVITYPVEKDYTDTHIALAYAKENGFDEVVILGGVGSRLDHSLANILLLTAYKNVSIIDENNRIYTGQDMRIDGEIGSYLSLIPLTDCRGISTTNLKYSLEKSTLLRGESRGVSNEMLGEQARVQVEEGTLLVVVSRD